MTVSGRGAFVLALLGGIALLPPPAAARGDIGEAVADAMPRLQASMNGNDCDGAMKLVSRLLARKDFATLEAGRQAPLLMAAVLCEGRGKQLEPALDHARMLTALPAAPQVAWRMRYGLELDSNRDHDALATLEAIQRQTPAAFDGFKSDWIFTLARRLSAEADPSAYRRLLVLMTDPKFAPAKDDPSYEGYRLRYARMLAKDGDKDGATAQLAQIQDARRLLDASLDPTLRAALPAGFDVRAAYERQAADLEKRSLARPALLDLPIQLAATQRTLGQPEKALATLEAARPEGALAKQFSDRADQINWWWDGLARTYEQLGRYENAVDAYRHAISLGEMGSANVSQSINLAYLHTRFGHPQDALAVLEPFASGQLRASPYGMMEYRLAHGCAAQALGRQDLAAADLAYAEAHGSDHPDALTDLQLCLGQTDAAAATMIARLDDADLRVEALERLSEYRAPPANVSANPFNVRMQALSARADVQAAIARAGGIGHFDIYSTVF